VNHTEYRDRPHWKVGFSALAFLLLLLWLFTEDFHEGFVIIMAGVLVSAGAASYISSKLPRSEYYWLHHLVIGSLAGLAVSPVAMILMALKTGIHAHETPDFTPLQMARVVELTPFWASAGLLVGLGVGIFRQIRSR
jgi:hypothetical protein